MKFHEVLKRTEISYWFLIYLSDEVEIPFMVSSERWLGGKAVKTLNGGEAAAAAAACASDEISPLSRRINMFATWFCV